MRLDRIHLVEYDDGWPSLFESQRVRLTGVLDGLLTREIEHIGSTSVPGLPAKPIVDMVAVVEDHTRVEALAGSLLTIGWLSAPEPGDEEAEKLSMCYPTIERRTHHLHVVEPSWGWSDLLLFRDYLRAHPVVAAAYGDLKRGLADADDQDRPRYRAAKGPFIRSTLEQARHWKR